MALYFLFKLWKEEYGGKVTQTALLILLTFPTAFYFGSVYSESVFLLLAVLTFWFAKKDKFLIAGIMAALSSATKIQGVFLFVFLAIELWGKYRGKWGEMKKTLLKDISGLLVSPLGLLGYMYYLYKATGDPVYFLTAQPAFGAERAAVPLVTLPQVIYRYIKMLLTVTPQNMAFWNAFLELFITLVLVGALIYAFKKIKFSYWVFTLIVVVLPTMTGTLTSVPRYALMAFPLIPIFAKFNKARIYIIIAQVLLEIALVALFTRGYWVA
jgi:Gpi18-like mannosyltransferase